MILLLFLGVLSFSVGILSVFSRRFDDYVRSIFPSSRVDNLAMSKQDQYIMSRYLSGLRGIFGGILMITVYILSEPRITDTLISWYYAIFLR
jgi:hypothetical protein